MQYDEFIKVNFPNGLENMSQIQYEDHKEKERLKRGRPPTGNIFRILKYKHKRPAFDPLMRRGGGEKIQRTDSNMQFEVT